MAVTAIATYGILLFERRGYRALELAIGALVAIIALCYLAELLVAPVDWGAVALGTIVPRMPDAEALTISVGIIGATVMPHALYPAFGADADTERRRATIASAKPCSASRIAKSWRL